jgi:hypothetical protein
MNVRINNNKPNAAQRKALRAECVKEFDKLLAEYNREVALQVLYILRFDFGFGQERLRRFSEKMKEMQITTIDRYEATDGDVHAICEIKLRDSGINVDEFLKEG